MSEPTLKDVLDAITQIRADMAKVDVKIDAARNELKADIADHRRETAEHRRETAKGFAALDEELGGHSEKAHRALEERLDKIEARLPASRPATRAPRRR